MENDRLKQYVKDWDLWKLVLASVIGGLVVAWLGPVVRRIPPK